MAPHIGDYRDEQFSDSDSDSDSDNDDDLFEEDMDALRKACMRVGADTSGLNPSSSTSSPPAAPATDVGTTAATATASDSDGGDSSETDNLEFVRRIRQKLSMSAADVDHPLSLKPLCVMPPKGGGGGGGAASDDEDDVFETFRAIQRRFAAYDCNAQKSSSECHLQRPEQVRASSIPLEKETSNNLFVNKTNACEGFPDFEDTCVTSQNVEPSGDNIHVIQTSDHIEWDQFNARQLLSLPPKCSSFPKSAQVFIDAIRKNRSCQKLLRSKLTLIEARIEVNQKLKERFKIFKAFQVSCKRRSGRALSQKKDPRVQLILAPKFGASKDSKCVLIWSNHSYSTNIVSVKRNVINKIRRSSPLMTRSSIISVVVQVNDRKASVMSYGPAENSHVANYRMVLKKCPLSFCRLKWSTAERGALVKGLRQDYQKALLEKSVELLSGSDNIDNIIGAIKDLEITDENIRLYLRNVDWDNFASIYTKGRSGAECEARWLNYEDPLINHNPWMHEEDKILRMIVTERGLNNWIDTAVSLGTNRTPFQCLTRYQRSLNPYIMKSGWTKDEDAQLCTAVEAIGEGNWQIIASTLEGRTGTQCSNRWKKSLHPARQRVGRWSLDEDKHLKVAVMLFGPKTWQKIARFVPGRTQVQCRERWVNSLDPSLKWDEWTEDEDRRLLEAVVEHNYCWSKVAACVPPRTDSQCLRRWKLLSPDEVPKLQAARKIQKSALISNFVDRESERPSLGPGDFVPLPLIKPTAECENVNASRKPKRNSRKVPKKNRSTRARKEVQTCLNEVSEMASSNVFETVGRSTNEVSGLESSLLMITNSEQVEAMDGHDFTTQRLHEQSSICTEPTASQCSILLRSQSINGGDVESSNGNNGSSTNKKRAPKRPAVANKLFPKPRAKRTKCFNTSGSQSFLLLPPQSSEPGRSNGDGVETCGNNITSTKEKRASNQHDNAKKKSPKQRAKRKKCTDIAENQNVLPLTAQSLDPDTSKLHDFATSHGIDITSTKKNLAPHRHHRGIVSEELDEHQNLQLSSRKSIVNGTTIAADHSPLYPEPTLSLITTGKVSKVCGSNTAVKRRARKPSFNPEAADSSKEVSALENFSKGNTSNRKKSSRKKQHKREPSEEKKDNSSIACREDGQKKSMNKDKRCSKQILGEIDEDDIPLACMFKKRRKVFSLKSKGTDERQS